MTAYLKPVVHLQPMRDAGSGSGVGYLEMLSGRWQALGHLVRPVPDDDQHHPINVTCPICSPGGVDGTKGGGTS